MGRTEFWYAFANQQGTLGHEASAKSAMYLTFIFKVKQWFATTPKWLDLETCILSYVANWQGIYAV